MKGTSEALTSWLLKRSEPWAAYRTLVDLLGIYAEASQAREAKRQVLADPRLAALIEHLSNTSIGTPSLDHTCADPEDQRSYYWVLRFLADVGITRADIPLDEAVEPVFRHQLSDGQFLLGRTDSGQPMGVVCMTAHLLWSLARLGFAADPHILHARDYLVGASRADGGWHCGRQWDKNKPTRIIEMDETIPSCPMANINGLGALSCFPELDCDRNVSGILRSFEEHWHRRQEGLLLHGFGIGSTFMKVRYPTHPASYDILSVLDAFSRFASTLSSKALGELVGHLARKQDSLGRLTPEAVAMGWENFDFGQTKSPSPWLSFLAARVLKAGGEQ